MLLNIPERIETERLWLIKFSFQDAEEIFYSYASKPAATKYMAWPTHHSIKDTHDFLSYAVHGWQKGTDYSFGIRMKNPNRLIGSCGLMNDGGRIQFGYILSPQHWGKGYATEATTAMLDQVKSNTEIYRIHTFVDVENTASANVLKKCGLIEEALLEKWFRFPNQDSQPKDCRHFRLPLTNGW